MNDFPAFTPTEFSTVADKEKFAAHFQRFVSGGFKRTVFPKWFYNRLSMTFAMIAHYDRNGFYAEYFEDPYETSRFLEECLAYPCYGDPAYTYSDVERYLQGWLREYFKHG
jgi:hypothetical protein